MTAPSKSFPSTGRSWKRPNADRDLILLTGPIDVEGAKPGDVLAVDILDVTLRQNWGFNLIIPLLGTIPDDFPDFVLKILPTDNRPRR